MAASSDLGFFLIQVAGIAVDCEHHVTFAVCENCRLLCCEIVHDLLASIYCVDSRLRLFGRNCTEGGEDCAVNPSAVPEKFTSHFLNVLLLFITDRSRFVVFSELLFGSICFLNMWVRGVLAFLGNHVVELPE